MQLENNQYLVESRRNTDKIIHTYWIGESGDIKNILKGQKLNQGQYKKFKETVEGILKVSEEIDRITLEHEKKIKANRFINGLETKITINNICIKEGKKND